eukprot:TRINITY_DN4797_c0_g1_i1.p1 TRINITY_DN4797_c0_g1~~TRINITY_DN4797_c0_g1_i1.p1  ORF type:complete len:620 (-),score=182.93 TRINITY_DN4797_c0_g1_i1:66-1925(-)
MSSHGRRKRRNSSSEDESSDDDRRKHKKKKHHHEKSKHKEEYYRKSKSREDDDDGDSYSKKKSKEQQSSNNNNAYLGPQPTKREDNSRFELFPSDDVKVGSYSKYANPFNDPTLGEEFVWAKNKREKERQKDPEKRRRELEEELQRTQEKRAKREAERRERLEQQRNSSRGYDPLLNDPNNVDQEKLFEYKQQFIRSQIRVSENRANLIDTWNESINYYYDYLDLHDSLDDEVEIDKSKTNKNPKDEKQIDRERKEKQQHDKQVLQSLGILKHPYEYEIVSKSTSELESMLDQIRMFLYFCKQLHNNPTFPHHPLNTPIISSSSMKKNSLNLQNLEQKIKLWKSLEALTVYQMDENNKNKPRERGDRNRDDEQRFRDEQKTEQLKIISSKSVHELQKLKKQIKDEHIRNNSVDVEYWSSLLSLVSYTLCTLVLSSFLSSLRSLFPAHETSEKQTNDQDDNEEEKNYRREKGEEGETGANEVAFTDVVAIDRKYHWDEKYRPRKPVWTGRVKVGWEWNKYNKLHFQYDNPPPKVVQGYSFSIVYSDMIDKKQTPKWKIDRTGEEEGMCVLRFMAGAPYEDIGFRIVDREWEKSHKKGFRCVFEKGVLHLWFNFKRWRYKR